MASPEKSEALVPSGLALVPSAAASNALAWLLDAERYAYDYFVEHRHLPGSRYAPISAKRATDLFTLYLNGQTLRAIWEQNREFEFGQIVHAAAEGDWHNLRAEYLRRLFGETELRARQAQSETVGFISDVLAAAHKLHGTAVRRYLQTGNAEDLGGFGVMSVRQYKDFVEMLLKVAGLEKQKQQVAGTVKHEHEHTHTLKSLPTAPPPPAAGQAALGFLTEWGQQELEAQKGDQD